MGLIFSVPPGGMVNQERPFRRDALMSQIDRDAEKKRDAAPGEGIVSGLTRRRRSSGAECGDGRVYREVLQETARKSEKSVFERGCRA